MRWSDVVEQVADRSGVPKQKVRAILDALADVALLGLSEGEEVPLRKIGTLGSRLRKGHPIRSIADDRKILLGDRFTVRFRPAAAMRRTLTDRTPSLWKDPRHQAAWRLAETLVSDLALYHRARVPAPLDDPASNVDLEAACQAAFGPHWREARRTFEQRVDRDVREARDYLTDAARRRWAVRA